VLNHGEFEAMGEAQGNAPVRFRMANLPSCSTAPHHLLTFPTLNGIQGGALPEELGHVLHSDEGCRREHEIDKCMTILPPRRPTL
jgi:hypothetical protein